MNNFEKLPLEVLHIIFTKLDEGSLLTVSKVCEQWKKEIHDLSWKSITRQAEEVNEDFFSKCGWKREKHELDSCSCIDLHLGDHPFKNDSWWCSHHGFTELEHTDDSKIICTKSKVYRYKRGDKLFYGDGECRRSNGLWQLDIENEWPSFELLENIEYEGDFEEFFFDSVVRCYGKALVVWEIYKAAELNFIKIRTSIYNTKSWEKFVCDLPLNQEIRSMFEDSRLLFAKNLRILQFDLTEDIMVISGLGGLGRSYFWTFDVSNLALPVFLTSIHIDLEDDAKFGGTDQILNDKYFCRGNGKMQTVFTVEDIKSKITNKSWVISLNPNKCDSMDWEMKLEDGKPNKLAVLDRSIGEIRVFNIENGDCLIHLTSEAIPPEMQFCYMIKFFFGKLICACTQRNDDDGSLLLQFCVFDESAVDKVVFYDTKYKLENSAIGTTTGNYYCHIGTNSVLLFRHSEYGYGWDRVSTKDITLWKKGICPQAYIDALSADSENSEDIEISESSSDSDSSSDSEN